MSAQNVSPIAIVENMKEKKPVLSGKYSKFMTFGFWLASLIESSDMKEEIYKLLQFYGSVAEQTAVFERFFEQEKATAKALKKLIADHHKPPKPAKATRKSKAVVHQDDLIAQLITDANAEVAPKPTKEERLAAKETEKLAAKEAKEAEKLAAKQAILDAKEAEKAQKQAEKEAKAAKKAQPKPTKEEILAAKEAEKQAAKEAKEAEKLAAKLAKEAEILAAKEAKEAQKLAEKEAKEAEKLAKKKKPATTPIAQEPVVLEVLADPVQELTPEVIADPVPEVVADTEELTPEVIEAPVHVAPEVAPENNKKTTKATKEPKAPKEKPQKETKAKKTKNTPEPKAPEEEEDEEIQTRIATIGGKDYLIDNDLNIYTVEAPHDHIGVYNQETGEIESL